MPRFKRRQMGCVLLVAAQATVAHASLAPPPSNAVGDYGLDQPDADSLSYDSYRDNEEWWKDPLAMFDDEEEDENIEQEDSMESLPATDMLMMPSLEYVEESDEAFVDLADPLAVDEEPVEEFAESDLQDDSFRIEEELDAETPLPVEEELYVDDEIQVDSDHEASDVAIQLNDAEPENQSYDEEQSIHFDEEEPLVVRDDETSTQLDDELQIIDDDDEIDVPNETAAIVNEPAMEEVPTELLEETIEEDFNEFEDPVEQEVEEEVEEKQAEEKIALVEKPLDTPKLKPAAFFGKTPQRNSKPHRRDRSHAGSSSVVSGGSAALLTALGPRLKNIIAGNPATVKWVAIAAAGQALVSFVNPALRRGNERKSAQEGEEQVEEEEDDSEEYDELEETYGNEKYMDAQIEQTILEDYDSEEFEHEGEEQVQVTEQAAPAKRKTSSGATADVSRGGGWKQAWTFLPLFGPRLPSRKVLVEQVEELETQLEEVNAEKTTLEREHDAANYRLREYESEMASLQQTTRYLKTQLRDQEAMLERVVAAERQKARGELTKMKDAMVQVVDKERDAMRDEFMKQASELQSLWKEKTGYGHQ